MKLFCFWAQGLDKTILKLFFQGWDEGLVGMCVGEKWRLFIPASLAYGTEGGGTPETPGGDLIYEVELVHAEQGPRHPEVFDMMDLDGDGFLTRFEITKRKFSKNFTSFQLIFSCYQ